MRNGVFLAFAVGLASLVYLFKNEGTSALESVSDFNKYDAVFMNNGAIYSVPWRWLKAIAIVESALGTAASVVEGMINPSDVDGSASSDGKSWGLMQVTLSTARALEGRGIQVSDLNDVNTSVRLAAKLLQQLIGTFGIDDRNSIIRAYNGGPHFGLATLPYYTKFLAAIATVLNSNPGNELEF